MKFDDKYISRTRTDQGILIIYLEVSVNIEYKLKGFSKMGAIGYLIET